MPPYTLSTRQFKSKKDAQTYVGALLKSSKPGVDLDEPTAALLKALLGRHPKKGDSVKDVVAFQVQKNATFGQNEFLYVTADGETNF